MSGTGYPRVSLEADPMIKWLISYRNWIQSRSLLAFESLSLYLSKPHTLNSFIAKKQERARCGAAAKHVFAERNAAEMSMVQ